MSLPCGCNFSCHCGMKREFTKITNENIQCTLVQALNPIADMLRDISVSFGARQYQVALVWTRWTGDSNGGGNEEVVCEEFLLPTPLVRDIDVIRHNIISAGRFEQGDLRVSEISPRYTEDYLMGRHPDVAPEETLPKNMAFFWEITFPKPGELPTKRRMFPSSPPAKNPTKFEWAINLTRQAGDRLRTGDVQ